MNPIREAVHTNVTPAQLAELHSTGKLIDGIWIVVTEFGEQCISRVRVIEEKRR